MLKKKKLVGKIYKYIVLTIKSWLAINYYLMLV